MGWSSASAASTICACKSFASSSKNGRHESSAAGTIFKTSSGDSGSTSVCDLNRVSSLEATPLGSPLSISSVVFARGLLSTAKIAVAFLFPA